MKKNGFTLIELLVVIAIIALLASIILVSLNGARNKGKDTRVVSDVQQTRAGIETGFNNGLYPDLQPVVPGGDPQTAVAGQLNVSGSNYNNLNILANDILQQGGALTYIINTDDAGNVTDYALYGELTATSGTYFCMDSQGDTNPSATTNTDITCP